jgi:hypothetical protein
MQCRLLDLTLYFFKTANKIYPLTVVMSKSYNFMVVNGQASFALQGSAPCSVAPTLAPSENFDAAQARL